MSYLRKRGVVFHSDVTVTALELDGGRIASASSVQAGRDLAITADYFVSALPVEVMSRLVTPAIAAAAPSLANLHELKTEWMSGIQFYLDKDPSVVRGHTIYTDSTWALTSVSQRQFWPDVDLSQFGDGTVRGILSIDISDWDLPGTETTDKPARDCTAEEVAREVWAQIEAHLSEDGVDELEGAKGARLLHRSVSHLRSEWGNEWRTAPREHGRKPSISSGSRHGDPEPGPRVRLCSHAYGSRDDGGGERSGAARRERNHSALGRASAAVQEIFPMDEPVLSTRRRRPWIGSTVPLWVCRTSGEAFLSATRNGATPAR